MKTRSRNTARMTRALKSIQFVLIKPGMNNYFKKAGDSILKITDKKIND